MICSPNAEEAKCGCSDISQSTATSEPSSGNSSSVTTDVSFVAILRRISDPPPISSANQRMVRSANGIGAIHIAWKGEAGASRAQG